MQPRPESFEVHVDAVAVGEVTGRGGRRQLHREEQEVETNVPVVHLLVEGVEIVQGLLGVDEEL